MILPTTITMEESTETVPSLILRVTGRLDANTAPEFDSACSELIAEDNDTEVIIRVRDTGIGISPEDQHRVFSKFFRSDNEEVRKRTGHGLGLSLVNEIVKLHHGRLQLNSKPGEGSEFVISFKKENNMLKDVI